MERIGFHWTGAVLCFLVAVATVTGQKDTGKDCIGTGVGHFNGGSISYSLSVDPVTNITQAHLDIITGWKLGEGPCGPSCSKHNVGDSTIVERQTIEAGRPEYYGVWKTEYRTAPSSPLNTSTIDPAAHGISEKVIAVNEMALWEQEWMTMTVDLEEGLKEEDIVFEGCSWRNLTLQGQDQPWHIQAKIAQGIRNDTNKPNFSPKAFAKPYYRFKLNKVNKITIAAVDPDGDHVKCITSQFVEMGKVHAAPGLDITDDCVLTFDASESLGYKDDSWAVVAITVHDYNKQLITVGTEMLMPSSFSMSGTSVQFLVQIMEHLEQPEFVTPTKPNNHVFYLYAEATWKTGIYATASVNATIDDFIVIGRSQESFTRSSIQDDLTRPLTKFIELTWLPGLSDVGNHIVCVSVTDNTGVDSAEDKCFIIEVKDEKFTHSSTVVTGKPYFIDLPRYEETVACIVGATCVIPIFVKSTVEVKDIRISQNFVDDATIGSITHISHGGGMVYKADLAFRHSVDGTRKLCFIATDKKGVTSEETCIQSNIKPQDPCKDNQCKNSAMCEANDKDPLDYICHCVNGAVGKKCDKMPDQCASSPCVHGLCLDYKTYYICYCDKGYTSSVAGNAGTCDVDTNECQHDPCNGNGLCVDGVNSYDCNCYPRYSGKTCDVPLCPSEPPGTLHCPKVIPGCTPDPCNGKGVCAAGPVCTCQLGYRSSNCSTPVGDISKATIEFVPPTLTEGSVMTCYITDNDVFPCKLSVFMTVKASGTPSVIIDDISEDLKKNSKVGSVASSSIIDGQTNVYMADITITGTSKTRGLKFVCVQASDSSAATSTKLCVEVSFITSPLQTPTSQVFKEKNLKYKFVDPTPIGSSHFVCQENKMCDIFLYTTQDTGTCKNVFSSDVGVTVHPARVEGVDKCVTDVTYKFTTEGDNRICFQANEVVAQSQSRCFFVKVFSASGDPCSTGTNPCQYEGMCFYNTATTGGYHCTCQKGYTGSNCEKGQCLPVDNKCIHGYCAIDNHVSTCLCNLGYSGTKCDQEIPKSNPDPANTGAKFTDVAVPSVVTCIKNRPCNIQTALSGVFGPGKSPIIKPGYISPSVTMGNITTTKQTSPNGTFLTNFEFTSKSAGPQDLCVQTFSDSGLNEDEICFKLDVKSETSSLYSFKNLPHFIDPSLPPSSSVRCTAGQTCHVLYHATPGEGHETKCLDFQFTKAPFDNMHMFTGCDPCTAGSATNNDCSIDVTVLPSSGDIGNTIVVCLLVSTAVTLERGEERCFNVIVQTAAEFQVKGGCEKLHCENGGFCDGHDNSPVCYCPKGFSGSTCHTVDSSASSSSQTFKGDNAVPNEIKCHVDEACIVPYQVMGKTGAGVPVVSTGYTSPDLGVKEPSVDTKAPGDTSTDYHGTLVVTPTNTGPHTVCLQTNENSLVADEMCITVDVVGGKPDKVEKTRAYFLAPTPSKDSTVICETDKHCHVDIHFTKGDKFGEPGVDCPTLTDTSPTPVAGLHMFDAVSGSDDCTSDINYIPPIAEAGNTQILCLQVGIPGKQGEARCLNIKVVADVGKEVLHPCAGMTCESGSKCVSDLTVNPPQGHCICPQGYQGNDCKTAVDKTADLPGLTGGPTATPTTPHFDPTSALPKVITCIAAVPCPIPIPYNGKADKPPVLGFVDPDLTLSPGAPIVTTLTPGTGMTLGSHILTPTVTSSVPGQHKMCLQTTSDGSKTGDNADELCFNVEIKTDTASTLDVTKPYFRWGNLPNGSTVTCDVSSTCHLQVFTQPNGTTCAPVLECGSGVAGVHIYPTTLKGGQCVADFAYRTDSVEDTHTVCIAAGPHGEEKDIIMETKHIIEYGPCQKLHCKHGQFCNANTKLCNCNRLNFGGDKCQYDCNATTPVASANSSHIETNGTTTCCSSRYTCNTGYEDPTHSLTIVCSSAGVWDATPTCLKKDCGAAPVSGTHSAHQSEIGTKYGDTATYTCDTGYELPAPDLVLQCQANGTWTPAPVCIIKDCGAAPVSGTQSTHQSDTGTKYGNTATYACDTGYENTVAGSLNIKCTNTGSWDTAPTCLKKDCGPAPTTGSGCTWASSKGTGYQDTATYTCDGSYEIASTTDLTIQCTSTGTWQVTPTCTQIDCGTVPVPGVQSVLVSHGATTMGSTAVYQCNTGYKTTSTLSITCQHDATWTTPPTCTLKDCHAAPLTGSHSHFESGTRTQVGSTATYKCETGYEKTAGSLDIQCKQDGTWQSPPACTIKECGSAPTNVSNALLASSTGTTYGSNAVYKCETGYNVTVGTLDIQCLASGSWDTAPTCTKKDCGTPPPTGSNSHFLSTSSTVYGSKAMYACNTGYQLTTGSLAIPCQADGTWATAPFCSVIPPVVGLSCGNLPSPGDHSTLVSSNGTAEYDVATYTCDAGYQTMDPKTTITCIALSRALGMWEPVPMCHPKDCGSAPTVSHTVISTSSPVTTFDSSITYTCDTGYKITSGSQTIKCLATGAWDTAPTCTIQVCGPAPLAGTNSTHQSQMGTKYGNTATYTCNTGYEHTGSLTIKCTKTGGWEPTPICVVKDCHDPPVTGGNSVFTTKTGTTFGSTATYSCKTGYEKSTGSLDIKCLATGNWETVPTCTIKDCGPASAVPDATVTVNTGTSYGDTITYKCDKGYELTAGVLVRTCLDTKAWGSPPTCTIIDCGVSPTPASYSSKVSQTGSTYGEEAVYTCDTGYEIHTGSLAIKCTETGSWEQAPVCLIKDCLDPSATGVNSVYVTKTGTTFGSAATYSCKTGYEKTTGSLNTNCLATGNWATVPTCTIKDCGPASVVTGVSVAASTGTSYCDTVTYKCDKGYKLSAGTLLTTCLDTGAWEPSPSCTLIDCQTPPTVSHSSALVVTATTYGSTATYTCDTGYHLTAGSLSITCTDTGVWTTGPTCTLTVAVAGGCGSIPVAKGNSMLVSSTGMGIGDTAVYSCNTGYQTLAPSTLTCGTTGGGTTWGTPPTCTIKDCRQPATPIAGSQLSLVTSVTPTTVGSKVSYTCGSGYTVDIGSLTVTCQDTGLWETPPMCKPKDCGQPPATGTKSGWLSKDGTTFGSTAVYKCTIGYQLLPVTGLSITCTDTGAWEPTPVCTIKDCGSPPTSPSTILHSKTGTQYGSVAQYKCDVGYETTLTLEIHCTDTWELAPVCTIKDCHAPPTVSHSSTTPMVPTTTYGSSTTYHCDKGYLLKGVQQTIFCLATGQWDIQPHCEIKDCHTPTTIGNAGSPVVTSTTFGSTASYTCNTGYQLTGSRSITCQADGQWEPTPTCSIVDCHAPPSVLNAVSPTITGTTYSETVTYSCNVGYQMTGSATITCQGSGHWGTPLVCVIKDCQTPPTVTQASPSVTTTTYGSTATYSCNTGYQATGSNTVTCQHTGVWTTASLVCTIKDCLPPTTIGNAGSPVVTTTTFGGTASYTCNTGYQLTGSSPITCQADGHWASTPTCSIVDCHTPPSVTHASPPSVTSTTYGSTATYSCNTGYQLTGSSSIKCLSTGLWDTALPVCTIKDCHTPPSVTHASPPSVTSTTYGSTATYSCNTGYQLTGSSSIKCLATGLWDTALPVCTSIACTHGVYNMIKKACVCEIGHSGVNCEKDEGVKIPTDIFTPTDMAPPAFTELTIPEVLNCRLDKPCRIVLPVDATHQTPNTIPNVQNGHYTPGLVVEPPVTTPTGNCSLGATRCTYQTQITVTPHKPGDFKYCVQTTDNHFVNADELCYLIHTDPAGPIQVPSSFVMPPTLPDNSVVACSPNLTCHIPVEITNGGNPCQQISMDPSSNAPVQNINIFSLSPNKCKYDVAFTPQQLGNNSICFKNPGTSDRHCIKVDVKPLTDIIASTGPCRSLHCENGGFCQSVSNVAKCLCKPGYVGVTCNDKSSVHGIVGSIPENMTCATGQPCDVYFPISTSGSAPQVTTNVSSPAVPPTQDPTNHDLYHAVIHLDPSVTAPQCFNITTDRTEQKCINVVPDTSNKPPANPGEFTMNGPAFPCVPDEVCQITVTNKPFSNSSCPPISVQEGSTMESIHVFDSDQTSGQCVSYVTATPTQGTTNQQICMTAVMQTECYQMKVQDPQEPCDNNEASDYARKQTRAGYASCYCTVNNQRYQIIKKRPVVSTGHLLTSAGYGAAGMAGSMLVGTLIYAIVTKSKRNSETDGRRPPITRPKQINVRPESDADW